MGGLRISKNFVRNLFLQIYTGILFMSFFMIPFCYFYVQQAENILDIDYIPISDFEKISKAFKKTLYFILTIVLMLIFGLVFRPGKSTGQAKGKEVEWIAQIFDADHRGEQAISFCLACLVTVGSGFWIVYGGYGLGVLPIFMIKGKKSLQDTKTELSMSLEKIRSKTRQIQEKYQRSH